MRLRCFLLIKHGNYYCCTLCERRPSTWLLRVCLCLLGMYYMLIMRRRLDYTYRRVGTQGYVLLVENFYYLAPRGVLINARIY